MKNGLNNITNVLNVNSLLNKKTIGSFKHQRKPDNQIPFQYEPPPGYRGLNNMINGLNMPESDNSALRARSRRALGWMILPHNRDATYPKTIMAAKTAK